MKVCHVFRGLVLGASPRIVVRDLWLPLAVGALLIGCQGYMHAQASSGISGTVTDTAGSIIPGANIAIVNVATQQTSNTVTSSAGQYTVTGLLPGRYRVTVTAPGFSTSVKDDVNIEVSSQATIDFPLSAGSVETTVEVSTPLIALNTTEPELGTTIEPEVVSALPVEIGGGRGRGIDSLQLLAPGVTGTTFSHQVNGGVNFETEILYNGIPAPQSETGGFTSNFNPPFELINEFRVERSTFSAKFGLAQGAVSYQTASGTNNYHGDAFYINRNEFFDARGYFNPTTPVDRQNNYGFTIAGPGTIPHIYNGKDRTFFHFSLDFAKQNITDTRIGTVPTALEKTGNFSDFVDGNGALIPIYDPATGNPFPGNVIPKARISAISRTVLPSIPDPDRPGLNSNKNYSPNAFPLVDHNWGFSLDHTLTEKQSLHWAEWRNSYTSTNFESAPIVPVTNLITSADTAPALGSVYLLNYVNAVTPKLVATAGISWIGEINNDFTLHTGVNFAGVVPSPLGNIIPLVTFSGQNAPTTWGRNAGSIFAVNRKLGIAIVNNWLWTKGRNTFNIGGEFRRSYQDDFDCHQCGGEADFSQHTTAAPSGSPNFGSTGSSFASFLLGQVDSADRIFASELRLRNLLVAPYIQDDIKLTPKLTVDLGLRWDIMLPFTENNNQIVYLNPTGLNSAAGNLPGVAAVFGRGTPISSGVTRADIHFKNFGPRLGLAYALNSKTVVQAGYNVAFLNGGSFEYGTSKVAVSYGNLLQGSFVRNSTGGNTPGYGEWDNNPIPAPAAPPVGPNLGIGNEIHAFDPVNSGRPPYLQQWNINIQRQLPWNTFFQAAYIGNRAVHLNGQLNPISQPNPSILSFGNLLNANINNPAAAAAGVRAPYAAYATDLAGNATVAHTLSPYPQYSNVYNNFDQTGSAAYNGLQVSLEKRFSNGLSFLTSYTLSRTLGNVDNGFGIFNALAENKFNQRAEYTVALSDSLNNAKISGTYELPIGPGKAFVNNKGITGQIVGGLQVGFILAYQTGLPFGISENDNPLGCAGCFNRPNEVPGVARSTTNYKNLSFLSGQSNRKVFSTNAFQSTTGTFTLGNSVRNYPELRDPGSYNESINASKKFDLGEHVNFMLQMTYFNALNRVQFNNPNNNIDNFSNFGLIPSGQQNSPRQGQISGRITF